MTLDSTTASYWTALGERDNRADKLHSEEEITHVLVTNT